MSEERTTIKVDKGDVVLVFKPDDRTEAGVTVEIAMAIDKVITKTHLLAFAVMWACQNDEWREKVMRRAKDKVCKILEENGHEYS